MKGSDDLSSRSSFADDEESRRLTEKDDGDNTAYSSPKNNWTRIFTWKRAYVVCLHLAIAGLGCMLWRNGHDATSSSLASGRSWSPVQDFVEYEINDQHSTDHHKYSKYSGPPSKENDEAWNDLISPVYFNATKEEMVQAGESLHNMTELVGGGYMASLGVYHEVHCLRQLRLYLFRERYYPDLTEAQHEYLHGHLDHCIETLRLSIMCHGNTGIYSFTWSDPTAIRPATQSNSKSVCAKWSSIENWGNSRMISAQPPLVRLADVAEP